MDSIINAAKALSDETRLRILNVLIQRECCVCEVMQALGISQTRASRNLKVLHDAGFLNLRKEGLWSLYSIGPAALTGSLAHLIAAVKESLKDSPEAAEDRKRLRKARRTGPGCVPLKETDG